MKQWVTLGLKIFYPNWTILNYPKLPKGTPIIFAPTHRNSLMDALLLICSTPLLPFSLARGDIFSQKWEWALKIIKIKPVYRIRDGSTNLRKNFTIFSSTAELVAKGNALLIFPEASHDERPKVRTIQKGITRVAWETVALNKDLVIIPVGINYWDIVKFNSRVVVNFGTPFKVDDHIEEDRKASFENINKQISIGLKEVSFDWPEEQVPNELYKQLSNDWPWQSVTDQAQQDTVQQAIKMGKIPTVETNKLTLLAKTIGFIPALLGVILNGLPYWFTKHFGHRIFKDHQFKASMHMILGMVIYPLWYLVLVAMFSQFIGLYSLIILFFGPPLGYWSYRYITTIQ